MAEKSDPNYKVIAENRRARFDYFIESDLEVGIVLTGSEVKSLRTGQSNIADSYASVEGGELWLINSYIAAYKQAGVFGHEERRRRKLLVSRKELARLWQAVGREGMLILSGKAPTRSWAPDQDLALSGQGRLLIDHVAHDDDLFREAVAEGADVRTGGTVEGGVLAPTVLNAMRSRRRVLMPRHWAIGRFTMAARAARPMDVL